MKSQSERLIWAESTHHPIQHCGLNFNFNFFFRNCSNASFLLQPSRKRVGTAHAHLNLQQNLKMYKIFENQLGSNSNWLIIIRVKSRFYPGLWYVVICTTKSFTSELKPLAVVNFATAYLPGNAFMNKIWDKAILIQKLVLASLPSFFHFNLYGYLCFQPRSHAWPR